MIRVAGRICPARYRYGSKAIAEAHSSEAETLYVVGGLYGNVPALNAIEAMAQAEKTPVTICFNGDFNWFNVDDRGFEEINRRVLRHPAILGNVEAELGATAGEAGCGCAYPDTVDESAVSRSNRIHARLQATAARFPAILDALALLPMHVRYRVGDCRVAVVHGDAESLAGWRFDASELDRPENRAWLTSVFDQAMVDLFASSHTCRPAMRQLRRVSGTGAVINNGAAGMPNFRTGLSGLITRIATSPSPHGTCYGICICGAHVDALPVDYDHAAWQRMFLRNWPIGSDAYHSYFDRISIGTDAEPSDACK